MIRSPALPVLLAVVVRAAAVLILQSHHVPRSSYEHGEIAANLLAGRGFSTRFLGAFGPTSQQAPVYPAALALAYALGGVETPRALLILELGQSALGGLMVLGVFRLSQAIAPRRLLMAFAATLIAVLHPTLIYAATHVQVALLGATLLCWFLVFAYRAGIAGTTGAACKAGACLALLGLTDPILSLAAFAGTWAIYMGRKTALRPRAEATRLIAMMWLVAAFGVAPWIVRNAAVHGEFVAVKSTFGYAFWQGNCALSEGTDKVVRTSVETVLSGWNGRSGLAAINRTLWAARHEAGYIDDIALSQADLRRLGGLSEPERSRVLFRQAIAELEQTPGRYLTLCLRRFRYFWLFDETNPKTRTWAYRGGHLGLTLLALLGLGLARPEVRTSLGPTVAAALLVSLFHALTIVSARFHIPIEPLMAVWAGAGLSRQNHAGTSSAPHRNHVVGVGIERRLRRVLLATRPRGLA
jgi:hypothetical protein